MPKVGRKTQRSKPSPSPTRLPANKSLVRELNHRVKNNFQIVVSLMNLKKRMMPQEFQADLRFVEEHVQCMSVAYRLVYETGDMSRVSIGQLMAEIVDGLRQIAGLSQDRVTLRTNGLDRTVELDHAIAVSLFMAAFLPPYLDAVSPGNGPANFVLTTAQTDAELFIGISGDGASPGDRLRQRLLKAYSAQIKVQERHDESGSGMRLRFPLPPEP